MKTQKKIGFISLGCDKNRVDTEKMIFAFHRAGYEITQNSKDANVIIINTCSFICDSKKESIATILEIAKLKKFNLEKIVVCGCLACDLFIEDLKKSMPEVDAFVNIKNTKNIVEIVSNLFEKLNKKTPLSKGRILTTPKHFAYLKIADGCNNFCTYCLIPFIKGKFISEKLNNVLKEAKMLAKSGVKELALVAQDTTKYGTDLNKKTSLITLLQKLEKIKNLEKIRLLYCYPDCITKNLILEMKRNKKICHYIDMPLQHISNHILTAMNRHISKEKICEIISNLKTEIPDISIRSTFIVGFPGETEKDIKELARFLKKYKLDNVGFFKYSKESGTLAAKMKEQIPSKVKTQRLKFLSKIQLEIMQKKLKNKVGKSLLCYVDDVQNKTAICHSEFQSPNIDSAILIPDFKGQIGNKICVKITDISTYDLIGKIEK